MKGLVAVVALLGVLAGCAPQSEAPPAQPAPRPELESLRAAGAAPVGDVTARLSESQRAAIAERMRACWSADKDGYAGMSVQIGVVYDATGVVRTAMVGPEDTSRLPDRRFRAFAERALAAVRDPRCGKLALPVAEQGRAGRLTFRFKP